MSLAPIAKARVERDMRMFLLLLLSLPQSCLRARPFLRYPRIREQRTEQNLFLEHGRRRCGLLWKARHEDPDGNVQFQTIVPEKSLCTSTHLINVYLHTLTTQPPPFTVCVRLSISRFTFAAITRARTLNYERES